jgi:natural product precursor
MKRMSSKKLTLNKETLRRLDERELGEVAGGSNMGCNSKYSCPSDCKAACLPPKKEVQLP